MKIQNIKCGSGPFAVSIRAWHRIFFLILISQFLFAASCGYSIIGSRHLPFNSIYIRPVINRTYEPRLEDMLHYDLSKEFLAQGVKVSSGGDIYLDAEITSFLLNTIAAVDGKVKEQEIIIKVDARLTDRGAVTEFRSVISPIRITFETTGSVTEYVVQKERALEKAFNEISKEIVSKIIILYVE
ncbi:MAG: hypothetical protein HY809_07845 [Nitrospirae bacterium]|nr:hypothetical protein [Nitrospirota bacterium]